MRTSDLLVNYCLNDTIPSEPAIICDYFGFHNLENMDIILGIYQDLIKHKGITSNELNKALKNKKLNELIHAKYKNQKSKYYNEFCEKNINVGVSLEKLEDDSDNNSEFEITDDDHCPNCGEKGYLKNNYPNDSAPDCKECLKDICKICSHYKNYERICFQCYSSDNTDNLLKNIKNKIYNYNIFDKNKFNIVGNISINDVKELLNKQNFKCYICNDTIKTINWSPFCCYQFSIDRINDNKPHDRNNILISCYYCNCRHHPNFDQKNKICNSKCHTIKKDNIPYKNNIDDNIIEKFRLK
jgi:hypothetical protein